MTRTALGATLLALSAAVLAAAVYANTFDNPFVHDDRTEIVENQPIRLWPDVGAIVRANPTRPALMLSYAVNYALSGLDPVSYHVTNVLLHALNVFLLFWLVRGVLRDASGGSHDPPGATSAAFAAASLFAVHPIMTEAVAYVSGRSEILSGAFFLSSLLCFRQAFRSRAWWYAPALALFAAGLGAKETMGMLPVVLLAYDRLVFRGDPAAARRRLLALHLPLLALVAVGAALRVWVYLSVEHPGASGVSWWNAVVELHVMTRYLSLLAYPASQSIVQPVYPITTLADSRALAALLTLALMGFAAVEARRRMPVASLGIVWFVALLVPSAVLIVLAPLGEPMAEHRAYLASVGFFLAVGALASRAAQAWPAPTMFRTATGATALIAVLAVFSTLTMARNRLWGNPVELWEDAARKAPRTYMAVYGMADAYRTIGDNAAAVAGYQRAIRLRPDQLDAYLALADAWIELGRYESARGIVEAAMERQPQSTRPLLALASMEEQIFRNPARAASLCRRALSLDPHSRDAASCIARLPATAFQ